MRKNLYLIYALLCLLGLLWNCTSSVDKADLLLSHAGECMEIHPDRLHGRQQADYAFLLTQARDKNYLDSLQSDSLIKIAINYYENHNDKVKVGKASFYYGNVLSYQDKNTEAMNAYLNAQILLEGTQEHKLQGLLEE